MKVPGIKNGNPAFWACLFSILSLFSCSVEEITDPNNPSLATVLSDASVTELQALVTGLEARNRDFWGSTTAMFGSFGREVWAYFGSDPRFLSHWLGIGVTETYPDFFASEGSYITPYLAVKQANVLEQATQNSSSLTAEQSSGYLGFAKTIKAFQLLIPLMQQYQNGVRTDVSNPLNPGQILGFNGALQAIRLLLNEALIDLQSSGASFSFYLSSGFEGFNEPASFQKLNRALAARAALYAEAWQDALTALNNSFIDLQISPESIDKLYIGPSFVFGEAPDINNPLYYPYDQPTNSILIVHPAMLEDAIPGDKRIPLKFIKRNMNPVSSPGLLDSNGNRLLGEYQDNRWESNITPIPFIRNEELILIYYGGYALLNFTSRLCA